MKKSDTYLISVSIVGAQSDGLKRHSGGCYVHDNDMLNTCVMQSVISQIKTNSYTTVDNVIVQYVKIKECGENISTKKLLCKNYDFDYVKSYLAAQMEIAENV